MTEDLKEKITFHDAKNNLINVNIEIEKGKLSITGDCGGSSGQCQDSIKSANKEQKRLVEIWNTWHLNNMNAGTERQEKALEQCKSTEYNKIIKFLKKKRLYTDKGYTYGSSWLKRELPDNLRDELKGLCRAIQIQETERKQKMQLNSFPEDVSNEVKALALSLDLLPAEAKEDITEGDNNELTYCGINYFVGTEEEAEERAKDYLDEDQWKQAVENDNTTASFEEWQEFVINMGGLGHILNGWDGSEDTQEVNGTWYYIIRM